MKEKNWNYIKEFIQSTFVIVQRQLDKDSIDAVNHYLKHDEFEMAFEGLFIEIMKLKEVPLIDFSLSKQIGESLNLDKETVLDFEFWNKFLKYVAINR